MRKYETVYILRPDLDEAAIEAAVAKVEDTIKNNGGEIEKTDKWGLKKLAYLIEDFTEGYYVVDYFNGENATVDALDYVYKVSDNIIRSIVIKVEE